MDLSSDQASISFENVSFGYTDDKTVLNKLNFNAEPGQSIGIVGGSGSGKSTIIRLLYRFVDIYYSNFYNLSSITLKIL